MDSEAIRNLMAYAADPNFVPPPLMAAPDPGATAFHVPEPPPMPLPLILRSRDGHVTLLRESDDRGHRPIADGVLIARIKELGLDGIIQLKEGKRARPVSAILNDAATYGTTAYAYALARTEYDPAGEGTVIIGYPPSNVASVFDPDVDAWLRALGGDMYPRLEVWLASTVQRHIDRLAACLIIIGPSDIGKTVLAYGAARVWGATPPAMSLVIERFNADMLRAPILVDEEAQLCGSGKLSTKRFRDISQAPSRSVERKGKERVELIGAQRYLVGCNGLSDLRFTDLGGPDVIKALRDRMLTIGVAEGPRAVACRDALARLRVPGGYLVDLDRIAGHVAWLGDTLTLPVERFIGTGGHVAEGAILAGHVEAHAELFERLLSCIDRGLDSGQWYAHGGKLYANPSVIAQEMAIEKLPKWDLTRVRAALAPFKDDECRPRVHGRPRLWVLDAGRIAEALSLDDETAEALLERLAEPAPEQAPPPAVTRLSEWTTAITEWINAKAPPEPFNFEHIFGADGAVPTEHPSRKDQEIASSILMSLGYEYTPEGWRRRADSGAAGAVSGAPKSLGERMRGVRAHRSKPSKPVQSTVQVK